MKKVLYSFFLLILYLFTQQSALATDEMSFAVSPIFSQHQSEGIDNFYDIVWTPGEKEVFAIKIMNNSDKEQTYNILVNKARTNKNGVVDYTDNTPEDEKSTYQLTKLVKIENEVTIPANSTQEIPGTLMFPKEDFNGILMAGIYVSEKKEQGNEGTVSNTIAYSFPFVVRGNIDERPKPILDLSSIEVNQNSSETYAVDVTFENKGPNLMRDVKFEAQLLDTNGKEVLMQESQFDVTPETAFVYPVVLPSDIQAGSYHLILNVKHNETNKWRFEKDIEITKEIAQEIKEIKQTNHKKQLPWQIYIIILLLVVLVLLVIILFVKLKKNSK